MVLVGKTDLDDLPQMTRVCLDGWDKKLFSRFVTRPVFGFIQINIQLSFVLSRQINASRLNSYLRHVYKKIQIYPDKLF